MLSTGAMNTAPIVCKKKRIVFTLMMTTMTTTTDSCVCNLCSTTHVRFSPFCLFHRTVQNYFSEFLPVSDCLSLDLHMFFIGQHVVIQTSRFPSYPFVFAAIISSWNGTVSEYGEHITRVFGFG
jgi:hypothetical protein